MNCNVGVFVELSREEPRPESEDVAVNMKLPTVGGHNGEIAVAIAVERFFGDWHAGWRVDLSVGAGELTSA